MSRWRAKPLSRGLLPVKNVFEEVGVMMILTVKTLVSAVRPPYPYGEELVWQFLFVLKLSWFPLSISTFALNLGAPGLQAAGILSLFGALDRLGGFFVVIAIRWIGPLVTAVVVAGVAGTAITADLGARKIREELDALQVLGVDPVKNLVVPRFLALMVVTALLDIFAIVLGLSAGIAAELLYHQSLGGFFATLFSNATITDLWSSVMMCTMFGAIVAVVCSYKGMSASGGAAGVGRAVNQAVVISLDRGLLLPVRRQLDPACHQSRTAGRAVIGWLDVPRAWLDSFGEIGRFGLQVAGQVYSGRVFKFFGEGLRQAGILIFGSALIIWAFVFILGLQCGLQGAYFNRSIGAPSLAGLFSAYCDLREGLPYAFGYILAAKVGTGIVAEIGAMRISDEIDALEVMGIQPITFLCATRLLAAWIAHPVPLPGRHRAHLRRQLLLGGQPGRRRLLRRLLIDLLDVPEPSRPDLQPDQGDGDGDRDRAGRLLLRLHRLRRAGRRRHRDGEVDGLQHRRRPHHRHARHGGLLGPTPERRSGVDQRLGERTEAR